MKRALSRCSVEAVQVDNLEAVVLVRTEVLRRPHEGSRVKRYLFKVIHQARPKQEENLSAS